MKTEAISDDFEYFTSVENNLAIMREINQITFLDRMRPLMIEVTKELIKARVDFSKAKVNYQADRAYQTRNVNVVKCNG